MNKSSINNYSIWARVQLIESAKQRAYEYEIKDSAENNGTLEAVGGKLLTKDEKKQRKQLIAEINHKGYTQVMEEAAYTWFNRFIALRFMEVNGYLPSKVRVFTDEAGSFKPDILKEAMTVDLESLDRDKVINLLHKQDNEALYKYLLITQCNALSSALPYMFERISHWTELLFPSNLLRSDSVIAKMISDIPEEDWKDAVQIIGWMYQYYNTEPKQAVFDGLKKNVKITKEKIPAATQLFTPDWIVRYMVENSLGRLWLESHPNDALKANWKYYLDEAEQTPEVAEKLRVVRSQSPVKSPEDIRLIDPCMGSGHILVYAFDVLMQIYESEGYNPRDAAKLILEKNVYGLDIDCRAYQLAYFSLMMKARQYNRRIFTDSVKPQVYHPTGFTDGEEYGSLVKVDKLEPMPEQSTEQQMNLFEGRYDEKLNAWNFKRLLAQKYDVVVTNPPYMGSKGMNAKMSDYVNRNYPDSKSDLFAVFVEKCGELLKPSGYQAMITQHAWMFLSSYEKLRNKLLQHDIVNMTHLGARAFEEIGGEVVQTTTFVLSKRNTTDFEATYVRLVDYNNQQAKEKAFLSGSDRHAAKKENFQKIPGCPVAYWASRKVFDIYNKSKQIKDFGDARQGLATGDNGRFMRNWFELQFNKISFNSTSTELALKSKSKWFPYNKGGEYRKWYGNNDYVVNWENDGFEIKNFKDVAGKLRSRPQNLQYYFKPCCTWSLTSSGAFGARLKDSGFIFDINGMSLFVPEEYKYYFLAYLCSNVCNYFMEISNPTFASQAGDIAKLPIIINEKKLYDVNSFVRQNVEFAKSDWDSFETSWDFTCHPLVCNERTIATAFDKWEREASERINRLKANEEELNCIFIEIYGLQDELAPEVEDKDMTVRRADLGREIRSLINYAVGCMFGRYSLDVDGLAYAGGDWDAGKYRSFIPDKDNILPICDDDYFDDDILGRFVDFVRVVYGAETLEENLKFIADALGKSGTPRDAIRAYFLNDFYKDHCKIYQKRPIYWLFDSGKKNGFKSLIYLHRYQSDLLAKLRTDYVHEQQERYRTQLSHIATALNTATGSERARLLKQQDKLTEQLKEITVFEEKVHHLADQNIEIDLDDGVKKNYEIFTDVLAKI